MKKFLLILIPMAAVATSCYDDYVGDFDIVGAGFANAADIRTVVVGEGMKFSTGVFLGGAIDNKEDRRIDFEVDYSLVDSHLLQQLQTSSVGYIQKIAAEMTETRVLPASQYSFSTWGGKSGQAVIRKGEHLGMIEISIDSTAFLADAGNLKPVNFIPLRLIDGNGTDLIEGYTTSVIGVHYENTLFGNWNHGGKYTVTDAAGNNINTVFYPFSVPQPESKTWTLSTVAPHSVSANAIGDELTGTAAQLVLTLQDDGTITLEAAEGSTMKVSQEGECRFNKAPLLQNRKIFLSYKYEKDGLTYHANDTLTFRNRVRDGVNEWMDENQDKY